MPYPSAKKSTLPVGKALLIAKQRLPGWAWCVLNNETFHLPTGGLVKKSACSLVDVMKVFSFAKVQAIRGKPVGMGAAPSYAEAIIRKVNDRSLRMRAMGEAFNVLPGWAYAVLNATEPQPSRRVAFVYKGEPLSPQARRIFEDVYLPLTGNPDHDLVEVGSLEEDRDSRIYIALGKPGDGFDAKLPHPEALLRYGDKGEVARKARQIKNLLDTRGKYVAPLEGESPNHARDSDDSASFECESNQTIVPISKTDEDKQIVTGVVLAPYTVDTQGDVLTPDTIEEAAHKWLGTSRTIGLDHSKKADGALAVESYLMPYPTRDDYRKAMDGESHDAYKLQLGADGEREKVDPAIVPAVRYLEG